MRSENYDRSLKLNCSTCGNSVFEYKDQSGPLRCNSCNRVFTRDELISENGEMIEAEADKMKAQVMTDLRKSIADKFGKGFK
jgi:uncharacterized Zn finger protein (UPF0148 family)